MKRLLKMVGLVAIVLLVNTLTTSQASAAITCSLVSTQNSYPYIATKYCTGSSQTNGGMLNTATNSNPGERELQAIGYPFYLFHSPADYKTFFGANAATYAATDFGATSFNSNNVPQNSAVFEVNENGVANPSFLNTTDHEAAKALDALMGYVMNGGVNFLPLPDISTYAPTVTYQYFQTELTQDWKVFNGKSPCETTQQGVFTGQQDENGNYFCDGTGGGGTSLQAPYNNKTTYPTNQSILVGAWPNTFTNSSEIFDELFASSYAQQVQSKGGFFASSTTFTCAAALQQWVVYRWVDLASRIALQACRSLTTKVSVKCLTKCLFTEGFRAFL